MANKWLNIDQILPSVCLLCRQQGQAGLDLCSACQQDLPYLDHACQRCALPLRGGATLCGRCVQQPPAYDQALAVFAYQDPVSYLLLGLKFQARLAYGRVLGQLMAEVLQARLRVIPQLLLPVPLHRSRLSQRGYNQSLILAQHIGQRLHISINSSHCLRVKQTQTQSNLPAKARSRNVRRAFALRPGLVTGLQVAVVDDVMTTGSTAHEMALALRQAGAAHVQIWVAARAAQAF